MAAAAASRQCPELPPELVGLVLRRLPSLADRVRFRAVCRAWRRIAGEEPDLPPPLPWLTLLDGTFLNISDGEIHRVRGVPEDASLLGSVGNWLFLLRRPGGGNGKLALMNPFSKHIVELPTKADGYHGDSKFFKLVPLSSALDLSSDDSLFAVLILTSKWQCVISIGRRPSPAIALKMPEFIVDIAFFEGKLYALSLKKLFALEIVSSYEGKPPCVSSMKHVANAVEDPGYVCLSIADKTYITLNRSYLAESSGKLLQIRRLLGVLYTSLEDDSLDDSLAAGNFVTISFEVFELDLTANSRHKWRRLNTLGDQALFIGNYSKFLPTTQCGAQKNCIYFVCEYNREHWTTDPFRDCGVFNMSSGMITPLLPDTTVVHPRGCKGLPTWFFPSKTM